MRPENDQWDHNGKEPEDMENQDQSFKCRKPAAYDGIDQDGEQDDSPEEHDTMPRLRLIGRVGQNNQTTCHRPIQVSS